jgi:hypothetical protein
MMRCLRRLIVARKAIDARSEHFGIVGPGLRLPRFFRHSNFLVPANVVAICAMVIRHSRASGEAAIDRDVRFVTITY